MRSAPTRRARSLTPGSVSARRSMAEIRSGEFAKDFLAENLTGQPRLKAGRKNTEAHQLTQTGARLRKMMPFISGSK